MERYFVKPPVSGWHEVDREHFERFIENIHNRATPPTMTREELIKSRTKIVTVDAPLGRWIDQFGLVKCSLCKCHQVDATPYCPNCGANMMDEKDDAQ